MGGIPQLTCAQYNRHVVKLDNVLPIAAGAVSGPWCLARLALRSCTALRQHLKGMMRVGGEAKPTADDRDIPH